MQYIPEEPVCKYNNCQDQNPVGILSCCNLPSTSNLDIHTNTVIGIHESTEVVVEQHTLIIFLPQLSSFNNEAARVPMHHMSSQLFTETIVAEARMISCIASWRYSNYVFSPSYIVSPMLLSSVACVLYFTLLHLHTHLAADVLDKNEKERCDGAEIANPEGERTFSCTHLILFSSLT